MQRGVDLDAVAAQELPGGAHGLGETMTETAIRETKEETGIRIKVVGLLAST